MCRRVRAVFARAAVHGSGLGPRPWVSNVDFFASRVREQDSLVRARQQQAAPLLEYEEHHSCLGEVLLHGLVHRLRALAAWLGRLRDLPVELCQTVDLTYEA
jgi:hypothetical protein